MRQLDRRRCERDFGETGGIDDRYLGFRDVGIHRPDDGEHRGIADEGLDVLRTLRWVVFTADRIVEVVEFDANAAWKAAAILEIDCE